jgi:NTP pyrophosphatase (non-canonical NTP hydrolase)
MYVLDRDDDATVHAAARAPREPLEPLTAEEVTYFEDFFRQTQHSSKATHPMLAPTVHKLFRAYAALAAARSALPPSQNGRCPTCGLEDRHYYEQQIARLKELEAAALPRVPEPDLTVGAENLDGTLTIRFLQYINTKRAERWHGLKSWSALEWAGAMAGEAGEACNAAKKLKRIEDEIANINLEDGRSLTDRESASAKIVDEIADTVIYGVLLAERVGMDLEEAIRSKFNRKSEEYGFPERIPARAARAGAEAPPHRAGTEAFEKNGIRHGERVVCIDVPRLLGTVIRCATDGVDVRWDDGTLGELVWNEAVAYNAYRLQIVRAARAGQLEPTVCTEAEFQVQRADEERLTELFNAGYEAGKKAARADTEPPRCAWDEDEDGVWRTDCGHAWTFEDAGAPNDHQARFCFYCGLPITANSYAARVSPPEAQP